MPACCCEVAARRIGSLWQSIEELAGRLREKEGRGEMGVHRTAPGAARWGKALAPRPPPRQREPPRPRSGAPPRTTATARGSWASGSGGEARRAARWSGGEARQDAGDSDGAGLLGDGDGAGSADMSGFSCVLRWGKKKTTESTFGTGCCYEPVLKVL
jgi:hypothetical protein